MGSMKDHPPPLPETGTADSLVLYGAKGLERPQRNTICGTWVRTPADAIDFFLASSGLSFRDSKDREIRVLSHRQGGLRGSRLRRDTAAQTYAALLRSKGKPIRGPRWPDGWMVPGVPHVRWERLPILIDGEPTAFFEICRFDSGY